MALQQRLNQTRKPAVTPKSGKSARKAVQKECNPLGAGVSVLLHSRTSCCSEKQPPFFKLLKDELAKPKCRLVTDRRYDALWKHFTKSTPPLCVWRWS